MPMLKKNQCTWIIHPNQYIDGKFIKAEFCGQTKDAKARNLNYADEQTQYETFCPKHMAEATRLRKVASMRNDEDDDFSV